jgi:hypothetical protein
MAGRDQFTAALSEEFSYNSTGKYDRKPLFATKPLGNRAFIEILAREKIKHYMSTR